MLKRISYSKDIDGCYRPRLEVIFLNRKSNDFLKVFGLVDSGADSILIPHSLGVQIKLEHQKQGEGLKEAGGVGGCITYLERHCSLAVTNSDTSKILVFDTVVNWAYPKPETQTELAKLFQEINSIKISIARSRDASLKVGLQQFLEEKTVQINNLLALYETSVLLGRQFFKNFEFIQFVEKETHNNCRFIYKVKKSEISETVDLSKI